MKLHRTFLLLALAWGAAGISQAADCCGAAEPTTDRQLSDRSIYQVDASWVTDAGQPFKLAALRGHPVVLAMFFTSCGYACPRIVADMARLEQSLPAETRAQVRFVLVSFDDARDTPAALRTYREAHGLGAARWTLLRGEGADVRELAAVLGVNYRKEANGLFSHSNLITVLNSEGEIVHQRNGLEGGLPEATRATLAAAR
jgi:protein SCO1